MPKREQRLFFKDIIESIENIENYTFKMSYEDFKADRKTIDAVVRNLEIIGEAVKNIMEQNKKIHSDIDWKGIAGMRDKLTHGYFGVDPKVVWQTTQQRLPELKNKIQDILKKLDK